MQISLRIDPTTGQRYVAVPVKGQPLLLESFTNKGTAFTHRERTDLDLHGLVPPAVCTLKQQLDRSYESYLAHSTNIDKFIYLTGLHDRNEILFYRLVHEHIDEMMPIVYTPVVGEACQKFSHIYRRTRGIFIAYENQHIIEEMLINSGVKNPSVIVVTDGERILGLGDQGIGGMGIPVGKLSLYTLCAGVHPYSTLPITLDVGTDNEERLEDPLYLGMRHKRIRGDEYQAFIDRFVAAVHTVFPNVVLQWEDFLKANAIKQLHRFHDQLCTFNDDMQGTAGVVLAGILTAIKLTGRSLKQQRVLIAGAGASAQGISDLFASALVEEGMSREEAKNQVWTVDSHGLVTRQRPHLEEFKATYARDVGELGQYKCKDRSHITLEEAVANAKPTILLGVSGTPGIFTEDIVRLMAKLNHRPIIFALSNPTSKSECTPEDVIRWSEGRAIVATGSPFDPVTFDGQRFRVGQCNNAFIFPGVGLGLTVSRARRVTDTMFLEAAKALSDKVTAEDLKQNSLYPELSRIRECSAAVACATIERAVKEGHAEEEILEHLDNSVRQAMWFPDYLPLRYEPYTVPYREISNFAEPVPA